MSLVTAADGHALTQAEQTNFINNRYSIESSMMRITADKRIDHFPTKYSKPKTPTLPALTEVYGQEMTITWMKLNVMKLIEAIGTGNSSSNGLSEFQIKAIAINLIDKFSRGCDKLNLNEILIFFHKIIDGDYEIYGAINTATIGNIATKYLDWRYDQITAKERTQEEEKRKEEHNRMMSEAVEPTDEQRKMLNDLIKSFGHKEAFTDKDGITHFEEESEEEKRIRREHENLFFEQLKHLNE